MYCAQEEEYVPRDEPILSCNYLLSSLYCSTNTASGYNMLMTESLMNPAPL